MSFFSLHAGEAVFAILRFYKIYLCALREVSLSRPGAVCRAMSATVPRLSLCEQTLGDRSILPPFSCIRRSMHVHFQLPSSFPKILKEINT